MFFVLAVAVGAVFGGVDQYLGSLAAIPWLVDTSLLSAPWLLLPFLFGCTQRTSARAITVGCVATASALIGYFVMTLSPVEGVHIHASIGPILALLNSERAVIVGGVITAPFYGFLGYQWRTKRAWISALLVGGAICGEPLATAVVGRLPQRTGVWVAEICVGVLVTTYLIATGLIFRRSNRIRVIDA